jgi:molybdate transport system substrate-binding protein
MRTLLNAFLAGCLSLAGSIAGSSAAEIKLMCPAPMRTTIVDLVAQFERMSQHKVTIVHTPSKMIVERIQGGESFDISILTAEATDALIAQGKMARRVDIGRSSIGLGVRADAPKPDVSSVEAVKKSLLAVKSFARNEGAESGKHILAVFERLGIADAMKAKTKAMPVNTGYVAELVARGEVEMAAQQMPELKAVSGVAASPLPKELQLVIVFSAGVAPAPAAPDATAMLVTFLSSPEAAAVLRSRGLDPP